MESPVEGLHHTRRTIATLRLDVAAAMEGRTWLLLPEGFRERSCGKTYPLPAHREDLEILAGIPIPIRRYDCGCTYLRRVAKAIKYSLARSQSALIDTGRREAEIRAAHQVLKNTISSAKAEAKVLVEGVRQEAEKAVASLKDLFALGREGIEGQMKAHIAEQPWKGETIRARDFRDCFRMVLQGVKGLGLPSEQRSSATDAVMEELAASLEDTKDVIALAPGPGDETEH